MYEGRPQRYGTQWMDDPQDGGIRSWTLAEPGRVNELRASVGLELLRPILEPGPDVTAEDRQRMERVDRGVPRMACG
jgi:hypothetical protein